MSEPAVAPPHPHEHACEVEAGHEHAPEAMRRLPHQRPEDRRRLVVAAGLTGAMASAEFIGAWLSNSLALLSDAGHMLTDLSALSISLLALVFATAPPTERRTFGSYRLEVLAALANGVLLLTVALWIIYRAVQRLAVPQPIQTAPMFFFAVAGLLVNLLLLRALRGAAPAEAAPGLALRSAWLNVVGDLFSSVAVVIGAVVMAVTGWTRLDPLLSLVLCGVILWWTSRLIREALGVLLEAAPDDVDRDGVIRAMREVEEIADVHDVHIWTLSSGLYALSAHVAVRNMPISETATLLQTLNAVLCDRFRIGHTAIQFEVARPDR